ncbi:MAG: uncharacterized protein JWP01_1797 [Myxococcales bacterium]|nr:uncharacterized protein [Myxococcales bacterium]
MATTHSTTTPLPYYPPRAKRGTGTQLDPDVERVKRLAKILDGYFVDPIIGFFVPGAGDLIGSMLGMYTVMLAVRRRMSPVIIARMLTNLALDAALGIVPFAGDLFDVAHKANTKNVALLAERAEHGGKATTRDWLAVVGAALAFVAVIAVSIYAIVAVIRAIA